ncbi:MAG: hypothetical protein ACRELD_06935 [Longimicrobiales bacterium]
MIELRCPACGAPQALPEVVHPFILCAHCATPAYVDAAGLRRAVVTEPLLTKAGVVGRLRAAHLSPPTHIRLVYHPFWEFVATGVAVAVDARPEDDPALRPLALPTGGRRGVDGRTPPSEPPTVSPEAAAAFLAEHSRRDVDATTAVLVHHPLFHATLRSGGQVWLDGVEGGILLSDGPVDRSTGARFPLLAFALAAAATLLLPPPSGFLVALAVVIWPLRRGVAAALR